MIGKWLLKRKLSEPQPLPLGRKEFEEWSDRVISAAQIPGVTVESQKFALSRMLIDLKPTIAFEADVYFVHCLRKAAVNQVAQTMFQEIHEARKAREGDNAEGVAPKRV